MNYKYFFIYCTTNLVNGKKYVGKHLTNNIDDNYFGSGLILKESIQKYGREFFSFEILEFCDSLDELNSKEYFWIKNKKSHISEGGYNLTYGGDGGDTFSGSKNKETIRKSRSIAIKKYWDSLSPDQKENRIKKIRGKKRSIESRKNISEGKIGYTMSPEHKKNMIVALKIAKAGKPTYNQKKINMYDLNMNFIRSFDSIAQAYRETGHNAYTICKICQGKQKKVKNHIFRYNL